MYEQDLDGDGALETVRFTPHAEPFLQVFRGGRRLWQWGPAWLRAWKLQIADIDEDGFAEFVVGVNRSTRWYRDRQNTIHILGWTGAYGYAKWLGSRLGSPLDDFALARLRPEQPLRLITLERTRARQPFVRVYRWSGFGFTALWQSKPLPAPARLHLNGDTVVVVAHAHTYILRQPHEKVHFTLEAHHANTTEAIPLGSGR
ncbi:MAG: hypothetical protein KatS3mg018_2641 [Fimbriimonadales bacterium]|nr:MAG: hypothetical protein KatS3mg018_2641 [Fimbriimonadales bacterium]